MYFSFLDNYPLDPEATIRGHGYIIDGGPLAGYCVEGLEMYQFVDFNSFLVGYQQDISAISGNTIHYEDGDLCYPDGCYYDGVILWRDVDYSY